MGRAPDRQLWLPLILKGELFYIEHQTETPAGKTGVMERVLERDSLLRALARVKANKGNRFSEREEQRHATA